MMDDLFIIEGIPCAPIKVVWMHDFAKLPPTCIAFLALANYVMIQIIHLDHQIIHMVRNLLTPRFDLVSQPRRPHSSVYGVKPSDFWISIIPLSLFSVGLTLWTRAHCTRKSISLIS